MKTKVAAALVPRNQWVKIEKKTKKVDPDSIELSKSRKDEAEWFSDDDETYTVVFEEGKSPFASTRFVVPKGGSVCSGTPVLGEVNRPYKYSVFDGNNQLVVDPQIIIRQ